VKNLVTIGSVSNKNTIDVNKKEGVKSRRIDKFLNNKATKKDELAAALKLDFKGSLRTYTPDRETINSRSPCTTKSSRNKLSEMNIHSYRQKSSDRSLFSAKFKKTGKISRVPSTSDNNLINKAKDEKDLLAVFEGMIGTSMEGYKDEMFEVLNEGEKVYLLRRMMESMYMQKKQIADLEKSINENYKKTIMKQEEKIAYLTDEISCLKEPTTHKTIEVMTLTDRSSQNEALPLTDRSAKKNNNNTGKK